MWRKCATTSGNLIVIPHFAFLIFNCVFVVFFVSTFTADIAASSEMMPQILCIVTPLVSAFLRFTSKTSLMWHHVHVCFRFLKLRALVCLRIMSIFFLVH